MNLSITAETKISFDITYGKFAGVVRQDGGDWYLMQDGSRRWVANKRVPWPEVIRRVLHLIQLEGLDV